jgi:sugar (pentulose or hexulose) kinase
MQGTALVARMALDELDKASAGPLGDLYFNGGGSGNDAWLQCMADVTGRTVYASAHSSAHGAAILAAAGASGEAILQAVANMVKVDRSYVPNLANAATYDDLYNRFCCELRTRNYIA